MIAPSRVRPSLAVPRLMVPLAAVLMTACGDESTALVIVADGEQRPPEIDVVSFLVRGPGLGPDGRQSVAPLDGPTARVFPLSLALIHGGGALGPYEVVIEARKGDQVRGRVIDPPVLHFVPGSTITRTFSLVRTDMGAAPPPTDAGAVGSAAPDAGTVDAPATPVDAPATPADAAPTPPPDAAADRSSPPASPPDARPPSALDAGAPDHPPQPSCNDGCACEASCGKGDERCTCARGCACRLQCRRGKDCDVRCSGPQTACHVTTAGASNAEVSCSAGAACTIEARGDTSNLTVACTDARCEVDCSGPVSNCRVECKDGAACLVRCAGASNCEIKDCEDRPLVCPGGVRVCNRPCP